MELRLLVSIKMPKYEILAQIRISGGTYAANQI